MATMAGSGVPKNEAPQSGALPAMSTESHRLKGREDEIPGHAEHGRPLGLGTRHNDERCEDDEALDAISPDPRSRRRSVGCGVVAAPDRCTSAVVKAMPIASHVVAASLDVTADVID